ncbi:flagellar hook protein FlgE [Acerihabitans sp. TG2]|uniref:flagellar hook protein FlgE n=1 Tax=Acerihabitans sp. TG2 TaxID=3096008 RepID=UPI002B236E40|nr:flagellar hook protein FlgE [Acerihabitans sp. TG2]MEA9392604.1 flagellar hook protein FlgE [Acerihabitans sp. TG2]
MGFSQAVTGMNAASTNLDVIGNNIANSETTGFKAGSVSFADVFASSQVGLGVKVAAVTQDFSDGTVSSTGNSLNVAISNSGFFRLTDDSGAVHYSRDGNFTKDANNQLVNNSGLHVTGYAATGAPPTIQQGTQPVDLTIPTAGLTAKATTSGTMVVKLTSGAAVLDDTKFSTADSSTYSFSQPMTSYDSQGNPHNVSLYFVKTADNTWKVHGLDSSSSTAAVQDLGTMSFDASGQLTSAATVSINMDSINGSSGSAFTLDFTGTQQQYATTSSVSSQNVNGYSAGDLTKYAINNDGTITGTYSNGQTQLLGQVVLANFANPEGLKSDGNNTWSATATSGQAIVGTAGSGNFGTLTASALESSNVDLSKELVNLIVAQRDYQSNAQTIKAQNAIMQTLVSLS